MNEEKAIKADIYMKMTARGTRKIPSHDLTLLGYKYGISDAIRLNDIVHEVGESLAA